ncbi:MAG: hypothetical protein AAF611_10300 [Bacteroidota bacterium]
MKSHDIKDILEERRIDVSEHSWEKLAGQLDAHDRKQRRKKGYIPYAACVALLVGWLVVMMLKSESGVGDDMIVNQEETIKPTIKEESQQNSIPQELKEEKAVEETITNTQIANEENVIKDAETAIEVAPTKAALAAELQKEVKSAVAIQEKKQPIKIETTIVQQEAIVNSNADLKASILAFLQDEKVKVTNAEIDQLLKEAQESIKELDVKENINYTNFATADELLNEVEYELDMSFKQRVFEMVKRNIQRTRTADIDQ